MSLTHSHKLFKLSLSFENMFIDLVIEVLSILTVITQIGIILLIVLFLTKTRHKRMYSKVSELSLKISAILSFFATLGSLFLSEFAKLVPCELCWYQRIFMFPLFLISFISFLVKDYSVRRYSLALSSIGGLISLYHYIIQLTNSSNFCIDGVLNCTITEFVTFGYITIPLMAFTAFLSIFIIQLLYNKEPIFRA